MSNEDYIGINLLNRLISDNKLDKNTVTLESLLKIIIDKTPEILIKKFSDAFSDLNLIKYENIICDKTSGVYEYYRRSSLDINGNKIKVKKTFSKGEDKLLYDIPATEPEIELEINDKVCIIGLPIIELKDNHSKRVLECNGKICEIKRINHGTPFRQKKEAEYAPYNIYGNWFTGLNKDTFENNTLISPDEDTAELLTLGGESLTYTTEFTTVDQVPNSPGYLYEYKIKKPTKILRMKKSKNIEYMILIFMFFDIQFKNYISSKGKEINQLDPLDRTKLFCIAYRENNTVRDATNKIGKYNYTQMRNNLDLINPNIPSFNSGLWDVIRSETADDGDKALAVRFCTNFNQTKNPLHLNIAGWLVNDIYYFMLCNPKDILENTGVYILLREESFGRKKDIQQISIEFFKQKMEEEQKLNSKLFKIITIAQNTPALYVEKNKYDEFNKKIALNFPALRTNIFTEFKKKIQTDLKQLIATNLQNIYERIISKIESNITSKNFDSQDPLYKQNIIFPKRNYNKLNLQKLLLDMINIDITDETKALQEIKLKLSHINNTLDKSFDKYLIDTCKEIKKINELLNELLNDPTKIASFKTEITPLLIKLYTFIIYLLIIIEKKDVTINEIINNNYQGKHLNKDTEFNLLMTTGIKDYIPNKIVNDKDDNIFMDALEKVNITKIIDNTYIDKFNDQFIQLGGNNEYYKQKYLKYKQKYLQLKLIK